MPTLIPFDSPIALLLAMVLGGLGFRLSGGTQNDGSNQPFKWWDYLLLGVPLVMAQFDILPSILGMGMILGVLLRLGVSTILRGTRPVRFLLGPLTALTAIALPVYAFYARFYRLGIPQRERRIQTLLGKLSDAQDQHQQKGQSYLGLEALEQEGALGPDATGPVLDGYQFNLAIAPDAMSFQVTATPRYYGKRDAPFLALPYLSRLRPRPTGTHTFWMDQTGNLRSADTEGRLPKDAEEVRNWLWVKHF